MSTSEDLDDIEVEPSKGTGILQDITGYFAQVQYKSLLILFVLFIFICSDLVIDKFLSKVNGAVEHREPTAKGVYIQGLFLVLFYILFDMLFYLNVF